MAIEMLEHFSPRMLVPLRNTIQKTGDTNVLGIGFGVALEEGQIDLSRPACVRLYVRKKAKTAAARKKLKYHADETVHVSILGGLGNVESNRRTNKAQLPDLVLPTDITEVANLVGSARQIQLDGDPSVICSGTIVRWTVEGEQAANHWGILTVAHGFESRPSAENTDVTISAVAGQADGFRGKRVMNLNPPELGMDISLIKVSLDDMLDRDMVQASAVPLNIAPFSQLVPQVFPGGISRQMGRFVSFSVVGTVDTLTFGGVGKVSDLVHVLGATSTFVGGTSGCLYEVTDPKTNRLIPAAIQIGSRQPAFAEGFGQSLGSVLFVAKQKLNEVIAPKRVRGPIDVVGVF